MFGSLRIDVRRYVLNIADLKTRHPEHQSRSYTSRRSWRKKKYLTKIQSCHDVTFPRSGELKVLSLQKKFKRTLRKI
jgi:hypothetical protein